MSIPRLPVVIADAGLHLISEGRLCIYSFIELEQRVDCESLCAAVLQSFRLHPILACRFVEGFWFGRWQWTDPEALPIEECCQLVEVNSDAEVLRQAAGIEVSATQAPLCKVRVFRTPTHDVVCIKFSHIAGDGAACIAYVKLLSELYGALRRNDAAVVSPPASYPRSMSVLASQYTWWQRWRTFLAVFREHRARPRNRKAHSQEPPWPFPVPESSATGDREVLAASFSPEVTQSLERYAASHSATLNDLLLAAFYAAGARTVSVGSDGPWTLRMTVNLRRNAVDAGTNPLANLSAAVPLDLSMPPTSDFAEILPAVIKATQAVKQQRVRCAYSLNPAAVIESTPVLNLMTYALPFALLKRSIRRVQEKQRAERIRGNIVLSNVGDYSLAGNQFGGHRIARQLLTVDVMFAYGFIVGTWNGQLTITGVYDGREPSGPTARAFLKNFVDCLEQLIVVGPDALATGPARGID